MVYEFKLWCPVCSRELVDELKCPWCETTGSIQHGIPSFITPDYRLERERLTPDELNQFAELAETKPIRKSALEVLDGHEYQAEVLSEVYDVKRDSWRVLVADHLNGSCLDLQAGYGRRSHVLAELVDEVYAVDPTLDKLRILSARDDYDRDNVTAIHTTIDQLPFPEAAFDTVVVDLTNLTDLYFRKQVAHLERYVSEDGTIVLLLNGLTDRIGLTNWLGFNSRSFQSKNRRNILPLSPRGYRKVLQSLRFEEVDVFTLLPTARKVDVVFDINDRNAIQVLTGDYFSENNIHTKLGKAAVRTGAKIGLLDYMYPSYCIVGRRESTPSSNERSLSFENPYLISGRSRSIVLDFISGELNRVSKVPNRSADISINKREHRVISKLQSTNELITETLPQGHTTLTKFGPVRHEEPAEGTCLMNQYNNQDVKSFRRTLRIGYDWLVEFQRAFGEDPIVRSPEEVRSDLSFPPLDLRPPEINAPVKIFRTPVHGDFLPGNVYVRGDKVVDVIDWEYGTMSGWPIVDAGIFLLNVAKHVFGGVESGIQAVFCGENKYAKVADEFIEKYCSTVGIPYRSFISYLPATFLHRLKLDWKADAMTTYTAAAQERVDRVKLLQTVTDDLIDN